ncbi:hypothetical protein AZE42_10158 [Rhizopogon vesiculosus]|uniref:Uncharacterized protein n=1 Tax=Rhizopogon vesiculosus TaxID=180088 RepID=A0A1J8QIU5_9AGAM|nr:hypothetical protein AZE42_10158 [Rhizopogon vesiculosus]
MFHFTAEHSSIHDYFKTIITSITGLTTDAQYSNKGTMCMSDSPIPCAPSDD